MTALAWLAAVLSLALVFPPSLRLVNEGTYVVVNGREVLDRSIPLGSLRAIAFAVIATWFVLPGAQAAGDVRTFPLAIIVSSGVMGVVILLALVRSHLSPFGGPSRY